LSETRLFYTSLGVETAGLSGNVVALLIAGWNFRVVVAFLSGFFAAIGAFLLMFALTFSFPLEASLSSASSPES